DRGLGGAVISRKARAAPHPGRSNPGYTTACFLPNAGMPAGCAEAACPLSARRRAASDAISTLGRNRRPGPASHRMVTSAQATRAGRSGAAERALDRAERAADARPQAPDDRDADHDDQGEHHGILDGRRTVLADQETPDSREDAVHLQLLSCDGMR